MTDKIDAILRSLTDDEIQELVDRVTRGFIENRTDRNDEIEKRVESLGLAKLDYRNKPK